MAVTLTQTANPSGTASSSGITSYTVDIGTPTGDRTLWIAATSGTTTVAGQPTALTVDFGSGPVSATKATTGPTLGDMSAEVFYIAAPTASSTSTSATVSVTWSGAVLGTGNQIAVYKATGASTTPQAAGGNTSTDMDASTPLTSGSLSVNPGGIIFITAAGSADTSTHTVGGATADINADNGHVSFCNGY